MVSAVTNIRAMMLEGQGASVLVSLHNYPCRVHSLMNLVNCSIFFMWNTFFSERRLINFSFCDIQRIAHNLHVVDVAKSGSPRQRHLAQQRGNTVRRQVRVIQKWNSWTNFFSRGFWHELKSSQARGFIWFYTLVFPFYILHKCYSRINLKFLVSHIFCMDF